MLFLISYWINEHKYSSLINSVQAVIIGLIADYWYKDLHYLNCISVIMYMISDLIIGFWKPEILGGKEMCIHHLFTILQISLCLFNEIEIIYCSKFIYILEFTTIFYFLYLNTTDNKNKQTIGLFFIILFYIVRFPIFTYYVYEYYLDKNSIGIMLPLMPIPYIFNIYWAYRMFIKVYKILYVKIK